MTILIILAIIIAYFMYVKRMTFKQSVIYMIGKIIKFIEELIIFFSMKKRH